MFDTDLVARISTATSDEMRAISQSTMRTGDGQLVTALSCDGGPLANSAHDPRWGRISETYGEDPCVRAPLTPLQS
jgi:beta-glucosidase